MTERVKLQPTRKLALNEIPGSLLNDGITEVEVKIRVKIEKVTGDGRLPRAEAIIEVRLNAGWDLKWFQHGDFETVMIFVN